MLLKRWFYFKASSSLLIHVTDHFKNTILRFRLFPRASGVPLAPNFKNTILRFRHSSPRMDKLSEQISKILY